MSLSFQSTKQRLGLAGASRGAVLSLFASLLLIAPVLGETQPEKNRSAAELVAGLDSEDSGVRANAALQLGEQRALTADVVGKLVEALDDPDETVRWNAAEALIQAGATAVPALTEALTHQKAAVRREAAFILGRIVPESGRVVPALAARLDDADGDVRKYAIFALGRLGSKAASAVPALQELAQTDEEFARPAAEAIARISLEGSPNEFSLTASPSAGRAPAASRPAQVAAYSSSKARLSGQIGPLRRAAENSGPAEEPVREPDIPKPRMPLDDVWGQLQSRASGYAVQIRRAFHSRTRHPVTMRTDFRVVLAVLGGTFVWITGWWLVWTSVLAFHPLWLLRIDEALQRCGRLRLPPWLGGREVSLSSLLFLHVFVQNPRVIDAWTDQNADTLAANFQKLRAHRQHADYCPLPVRWGELSVQELLPVHVQSALSARSSCILVSGAPGTGKTALAFRLAEWGIRGELADHRMLPVFIPADCDKPIPEIVLEQLQILAGQQPVRPDLAQMLLSQKRVLLVVDDMNDPGAPRQRRLIQQLVGLAGANVVVASRLAKLVELPSTVHLTTSELTSETLLNLIRHITADCEDVTFHDADYFDACQHLVDALPQRRLTPLVAKLFAEQMVLAKRNRAIGLPRSLPELIRRVVATANKRQGEPYADDLVCRDLQRLAWMCCARSFRPETVSREAAVRSLEGENAPQRLVYLQQHLGIVVAVDSRPDRIRIQPDLLTEYLAGLHLVETYGGNERRWRWLLEQAAGTRSSPHAVRSFLLAVRDCCLVCGPEVPEQVIADLGTLGGLETEQVERDRLSVRIGRAVDRLQSRDPRSRATAAAVLGDIGSGADDVVGALVEALSDQDDLVRGKAADALRKIGMPAVPALTKALADPRVNVRRLAVQSLCRMGEEAAPAVDRLRDALNDQDHLVRAGAATALGFVGHGTSADLDRATYDENAYVRACAVRALGFLGPEARPAVRSLSRALIDDHFAIRRLAADALGRIGTEALEGVPALVNALLDEAPQVRRDSLEALRLMGEEAVPAIIPLLEDDDPDLRDAATRALAALGRHAADAVPHLVRLLRDEYPPLRESAADALEHIYAAGAPTTAGLRATA